MGSNKSKVKEENKMPNTFHISDGLTPQKLKEETMQCVFDLNDHICMQVIELKRGVETTPLFPRSFPHGKDGYVILFISFY